MMPVDHTTMATSDRLRREAVREYLEERFKMPPWAILIQLFMALGWIRAAVEKVIDPSWWDGTVLAAFIESHTALTLPWYEPFIDTIVEPHILLVSTIVVGAQLFAGTALLLGRHVVAGLAIGIFLNLNFVAAGAVNPSIFYLICQLAIVLWMLHSGNTASKRPLRLLATASFVLVLLNMPFITTLNPTTVIEDPAIVLVTLGLLIGMTSRIGVRSASSPSNHETRVPS